MERVKNTTSVSTKISISDKRKLCAIAKDLGLTYYAMVQSILLAIVRYCDKGGNVSAEHSRLIEAFGLVLKSTIESHIPLSCRNRSKDNIKGAILFVERGNGKRPQLMEVGKDDFGNVKESYNYDTMLSSFLNAIDPDLVEVLNSKAKELGCFSITAALRLIILDATEGQRTLESDIADLFSDIRITTGQTINEEIHYKQGYRKNVDEYTTIPQNENYRADI